MKNIVILGGTGSIGTQALDVIRKSDDLKLKGISVNRNLGNLKAIIDEFHPEYVAVSDEESALKCDLVKEGYGNCTYFTGKEGMVRLAGRDDYDMVLTSVTGLSGLEPTAEAIRHGRTIALANKETLVGAGSLIMKMADEYGSRIIPVDSEHSAIFQSIQGYSVRDIRRIILTASGGPFRGRKKEDLLNVSAADALKHPNWNMGQKVTIDSATLMNKGLEVIEARWLFDVKPENIDVHVHPESIVHSAVEFNDNSVIAQLGTPDMRLPIQYALNYPSRKNAVVERLDLFNAGRLTFEKPDTDTFRCLKLAFDSLKEGGFASLIINTADEIAVGLFLNGKIGFLEIPDILEECLEKFSVNVNEPDLSDILSKDREIREYLNLKYS